MPNIILNINDYFVRLDVNAFRDAAIRKIRATDPDFCLTGKDGENLRVLFERLASCTRFTVPEITEFSTNIDGAPLNQDFDDSKTPNFSTLAVHEITTDPHQGYRNNFSSLDALKKAGIVKIVS